MPSHTSAANEYGAPLWECDLSTVHLTRPDGRALELALLLDVEHALVEIDFLLHQGFTSMERLRARDESMTHWPRSLATDLVLRPADGRSESAGETRARFLCWAQHLPAPIPNYPILDERGNEIARVDLAWPALGLFLELDGKVTYQKYLCDGESVVDCVLREEQRESRIVEITGWRCIRVVWADLDRPVETSARIRAMFGQPAS